MYFSINGLHSASWSSGKIPRCGGRTYCFDVLKFIDDMMTIKVGTDECSFSIRGVLLISHFSLCVVVCWNAASVDYRVVFRSISMVMMMISGMFSVADRNLIHSIKIVHEYCMMLSVLHQFFLVIRSEKQ